MSILSSAVAVSVVLVEGLTPGAGASTVAYVSATATLGGARWAAYTHESQVSDAVAASELAAADAVAVRAAFASSLKPSRVAVVRKAGGEDYDDALIAADAAGLPAGLAGYLWLTADTRTNAEIDTVSAWVEGKPALYLAQLSDSDALTAGLPTGITARSQTLIAYHDTDTERADLRAAALCAGVPRPQRRPSGRGPLVGLAPCATAVTASQATAATGNGFTLVDRYDDPITSPQALKDPAMMTGPALAVAHSRVYISAVVDLAVRDFLHTYWSRNESIPSDEASIARLIARIGAAIAPLIDAGDVRATDDYPGGYSMTGTTSGTSAAVLGTVYGNNDIGDVSINLSYSVG